MFLFLSGILLISFWSSRVTFGWYSNSVSSGEFHVPSGEPTVTATFPRISEAEMKNQSRKSKKNVTVRTKQHGFDEFIYLLDLSNLIYNRIPILPIEIVVCTFDPFFIIFLETAVCGKNY